MKRLTRPSVIIFFSLIISLPIILPYFHKGYFPTHDGEWAVVRLSDMFRSLKDNQFPVRFSGILNMEYGYPLFNFAYPFPYYLGIIFYALRFGFIGSVKILFALTVPISVFFMFLLSQKMWKSTIAGLVSSILFAYLPYRIVDLYARGSIGESISFIFFPILFYVVLKLKEDRSKWTLLLGVFSYAALIMSHNIMAVYMTPLLVLFMVFTIREDVTLIKPYLILLLGGMLVSAFFWLPALTEKHDILLSKIPIADRNLYFIKPAQLVTPVWGYGLPTQKDGFSYQLGIPQVILFIGSIVSLCMNIFKKKSKKTSDLQSLSFLSIITICMIILLFPITAVLWKLVPLIKEINYPWTLLLPLGFFMSLIGGYLATRKIPLIIITCLISAFAIILVTPHAKPQYYTYNTDQYYLTNEATTTSSHEYMPVWVQKQPLGKPAKKVEVIAGTGTVSNIFSKSNRISFTTDIASSSLVRINTIYYPGWEIFLDNKATHINYKNIYGVMDFPVQSGHHEVTGSFTETRGRLLADILSVIGFIGALVLLFPIVAKKIL